MFCPLRSYLRKRKILINISSHFKQVTLVSPSPVDRTKKTVEEKFDIFIFPPMKLSSCLAINSLCSVSCIRFCLVSNVKNSNATLGETILSRKEWKLLTFLSSFLKLFEKIWLFLFVHQGKNCRTCRKLIGFLGFSSLNDIHSVMIGSWEFKNIISHFLMFSCSLELTDGFLRLKTEHIGCTEKVGALSFLSS